MDGISGFVDSVSSLSSSELGTELGVKALKSALEQSEESLLPLLAGLGENVDLTA